MRRPGKVGNKCRILMKDVLLIGNVLHFRSTPPDLVLRFLSSLTYLITAQGRDIASVSEAIPQLYRQKDTRIGDCFGRFRSLAIFAICVTVLMRMGT